MKKSIASWGIVFTAMLLFAGCTKTSKPGSPSDPDNPADTSPAGMMAGLFTGQGQYMPQGINLGSYKGCSAPAGWQDNLKKGNASVQVTKVDDNTIKISLKTGPFPGYVFDKVAVQKSGNTVSFASGAYDVDSKLLVMSSRTSKTSYLTTSACLVGLPYVAGWDALGTGSYNFQTIDHVDFQGTKP